MAQSKGATFYCHVNKPIKLKERQEVEVLSFDFSFADHVIKHCNMEVTDVESVSQQLENSPIKPPDFKPVPKKRKKRARRISILICAIAAILVITFCVVNRTVVEYHPDTTQKNTTTVYYIKKEKLSFPLLFTTALGLFGVVLGTLVDRLSLVNEERHHRNQRYDGSWKKMIKACFSGILWGPVIALLGSTAVIVVILIYATNKPWFELSYLVYIFSGIGIGPLIMHLLNLNSQSEVHISTILEEKGIYIGLAWSYYFNNLKEALPEFKKATSGKFYHPYENIQLTSNKLLLLIPHDGYMKENLNELDTKIEKLFVTGNDQDPFRFPIYRLTDRENQKHYCAIQYIKEPLRTLTEMSKLEVVEAVKRKTCEEEIRLLCRTLSEILHKPPDQECREMCMLVPISADSLGSLENGGLVKCIMDMIGRGCAQGATVFVEPSQPLSSTKPSDENTKILSFTNPTFNGKLRERTKEQIDASDNQEDDSSDKKGKMPKKTSSKKYTSLTSNHINKTRGNKKSQSIQEVGDKLDSGESTSGNTSEMLSLTDMKRQSDQEDEQASYHDQPAL